MSKKLISDLAPGTNMGGIKVKTPDGRIGYWKGQWNKGVWLTDDVGQRLYPVFVNNLKECLDWEIVPNSIPVNLK